jgi:hypothetical protein
MRLQLFIYLVLACGCLLAFRPNPSCAATLDFDVVLTSALDSKTSKVGQPVSARLVDNLRLGHKVLAPAGSKVTGQVTAVSSARSMLHSEVSVKRWMRADASIGVRFTHIVPPHGKALGINALPLSILETVGTKNAHTNTHVSKQGTFEASRKADLKPTGVRTALGIGSIFAAPVTAIAGAGIGAARPSMVLPTDSNKPKPSRLKGMATGLLTGLPGGSLITDAAIKGRQATLKPGTRIRLQWKQ